MRTIAVGRELISVRIDGATALDWRENYAELAYRVIDTPQCVRRAVAAYLARFGLVFGAFDLGLDRDGTFWWYECNPGGQWAFFDPPLTERITRALADLLQRGEVR